MCVTIGFRGLKLISIFLFLASGHCLFGQKSLILGDLRHPFQEVFRVGSKITYELEDEKGIWRSDVIEDIDVQRGWLMFQNGRIHIDEIARVRTFPPHPRLHALALILKTFGINGTFWSVVAVLASKPVTFFIGSAAAFATGGIIDWLIRHKTYTLHKKHFLRVIDEDIKTPLRA